MILYLNEINVYFILDFEGGVYSLYWDRGFGEVSGVVGYVRIS